MEELTSAVIRARSGDLEAYGEIIRRFQDMVYGYAYSVLGDFHLAEDVAAEAFFQAYRDLGQLREPAAFPGWFRRIAVKHCDRIARKKRVETVPLDSAAEQAALEADPVELAERREMKEHVLDMVRQLPDQQRAATMLFYIDGYSQNQIADFLEVPVGTVKRRLHDARKQLKARTMTMVDKTLKDAALPDSFADRLLVFPFPRREPEVNVVDRPGECLSVRRLDNGSGFVPLEANGMCDWCYYEAPDMRLSRVLECRVVNSVEDGERSLHRLWIRCVELADPKVGSWFEEEHILVEKGTWRWVSVERRRPGQLEVGEFSWPMGTHPHRPEPMDLEVGTSLDDISIVTGVAEVTIGSRSWRCLRIAASAIALRERRGADAYVESYVADTGRTVLFRRYVGPGYLPATDPRSFEAFADSREIQVEGRAFRHTWDGIPDIALTRAFTDT